MTDRLTLRIDAMANGGDGIARRDGKAVFVPGAIPGDVAEIEIVQTKKRFERGRLVEITEASPNRVEPPCRFFGACGGCSWQHADYGAQLEWKAATVSGQLRHLGGIDEVDVRPIIAPGEPYHYRNRIDLHTDRGRPALVRGGSNELVPIDMCLLADESLVELFGRLGDLRGVDRLSLRTGVNTGETVVILDGELPLSSDEWGVPFGGDDIVFHEIVANHVFQVTGTAFFQNNTAGAEALVELVGEAATVEAGDRVLDAYAGGGLFTATVAGAADEVVAIEADPLALEDLLANTDVEVIEADVALGLTELPADWDVVIVDPPRIGLGPDVTGLLAELRPGVIASVSCDTASFARDASALIGAGYVLEWVQPVDMFPQTPHIETVARFTLGR
ncbi:MAG: class I SAM-dependent RNA methyltransferase [Acidimicrobiia bacterium]|nr:class I SAM-dependent RNA methyltransferase [Acidimicrobiia bacterium]